MWESEKLFKILQDIAKAQKEREKQANLNEQDIKDLIDVALMIGDKEWFMELTEKLNALVS